MLEIKNLHAKIGDREILKGLDLTVRPGEVHAEPVATRYGFHVLRLLHHAPGIEQPYDAVRERIALWLRDASWRRALHQYVTILAGAARIEGSMSSGGR